MLDCEPLHHARRVYSLIQWAFCLSILTMAAPAKSDWPTLLGQNRDGHADRDSTIPSTILSSSSDNSELVPAWKVPCGQGYAGVSAASGNVAIFDREGEMERIRWVDGQNGRPIWTQSFQASYSGGVNPDTGPRCVPTITEESVVLYGAAGDLHCLNRQDGKPRWPSRSLRKEYKADGGYFGAGSTPLILGNRIVVNVGGKSNGGIVAISLSTGKTLWSKTSVEASYASPIAFPSTKNKGQDSVFVLTRLEAFGLNANNGEILFQFPFGGRGPTVNAATPILINNQQVFLTASYGIGSCIYREGASAKEIIRDPNLLASQYTTPIFVNGLIYGGDGREDMGGGSLKCIDPVQRKVLWEKTGMGICHVLHVAGKIMVVSVDGRIHVIEPTGDRFTLVSQAKLPNGVYRAIPAISNGTLFVRNSQSELKQEILAIR